MRTCPTRAIVTPERSKRPRARTASGNGFAMTQTASTSSHARGGRTARARGEQTAGSDLDCRTCGACCAPQRNDAVYVGVTPADVARMTRLWRERHVAHGAILTKLDPVGRCVCVALRGAVGQRVSCAIYGRRPQECRSFTAGSKECLTARRQAGL